MRAALSGSVTIRAGRSTDRDRLVTLWQEIEALHARLTPDFFRAPKSDAHAVSAVVEALSAARGRDVALLVAELDGSVVGFVHVALFDTPRSPEMVETRRARIEVVMVGESVRRRGVGRALVDAARAWSRSRGAEQLVLTVWSGNANAAKFYRALGFAPVSQVLGCTP